jgi:hypothetical protein
MAARPKPPAVHFHSVLGEAFGEGENSSDGVVPYKSAHLDGADSEVLVPSSHMYIHHHPRAILDVRHILLEHLRAVEAGEAPAVVPAAGAGR